MYFRFIKNKRMYIKDLLLSLTLCFSFSLFSQKPVRLKAGKWTGSLTLTEQDFLPFEVELTGKKNNYLITIINGEERILLDNPLRQGDSLIYSFPNFNSRIVLMRKNKKELNGYWQNMNKNAYRISLSLRYGDKERFTILSSNQTTLPKKWEITFDPETQNKYKSVGLFHEVSNKVHGTFLTETGDYRFLAGNRSGDSLYLSCFDGSHAYLFKSVIKGDSIYGDFFSGKHFKGKWQGRSNDQFELTHPDSLTYLVNDEPFTFTLQDLAGEKFTFPSEHYKGKVTIIQIMGTWCPNCMDETRFLKEVHMKYGQQGLEIISIGYEVGKSFEEYADKITSLQKRYDLPFKFLVGGAANKGLASEHFAMLNKIISFPTAIFIARDGTVRKVHTGFNGPGTGSYYTDFVKETNLFIESLLNE